MPPKKLEQRSSKAEKPEKPEKTDVTEDELKRIANKSGSPESKLQEAASNAEAALAAQKAASSLRTAAESMKDPKKREQYLRDAYNKEIEAHGNSKKARVLSSGAFQGGVGGGGIGMAVGAGLGTVVGTLVGTVATIPTTAVGTLVGAGVGGIHGPWIKLSKIGKGKDEDDENKENENEEEIDVEDAVPNPEVLRQAADKVAEERKKGEADGDGKAGETPKKEKKKPRKLEVRGKPS
ncbi:hypothetical protein BKA66DRAFT_515378 [Pyrenochaeta sp. MPI-SDFR-AT-0127]|nr:hypothetical protein BKA66DRAFT_515378 [Pyrenochaeta sp. MPI-SDFR-AT-0127]